MVSQPASYVRYTLWVHTYVYNKMTVLITATLYSILTMYL